MIDTAQSIERPRPSTGGVFGLMSLTAFIMHVCTVFAGLVKRDRRPGATEEHVQTLTVLTGCWCFHFTNEQNKSMLDFRSRSVP